jgi:hypothetical protein
MPGLGRSGLDRRLVAADLAVSLIRLLLLMLNIRCVHRVYQFLEKQVVVHGSKPMALSISMNGCPHDRAVPHTGSAGGKIEEGEEVPVPPYIQPRRVEELVRKRGLALQALLDDLDLVGTLL